MAAVKGGMTTDLHARDLGTVEKGSEDDRYVQEPSKKAEENV